MSQINQTLGETNIEKRLSLIVWLKKANDQFKLRPFGDIVYFSQKWAYCILYLPEDSATVIEQELKALDFVSNVMISQREDLHFTPDYQEKMMAELKAKYDKMREENEDMRV